MGRIAFTFTFKFHTTIPNINIPLQTNIRLLIRKTEKLPIHKPKLNINIPTQKTNHILILHIPPLNQKNKHPTPNLKPRIQTLPILTPHHTLRPQPNNPTTLPILPISLFKRPVPSTHLLAQFHHSSISPAPTTSNNPILDIGLHPPSRIRRH